MNDIWAMPLYYFHEIIDAMKDKAERQKQSLARNSNTQTL
jgi:hypothetical protein